MEDAEEISDWFEFKYQIMADTRTSSQNKWSGIFFEQQMVLSDNKNVYIKSNNYWEKIGISIGLVQAVYFLTMVLIRPLARHSFLIRAMKRLYFARTSSDSLFKEPS